MTTPGQPVDTGYPQDPFLMCPMCERSFNQTDRRPHLLHFCFHALCTQCLHQLSQDKIGEISCPICHLTQNVTGKADTFPKDLVRDKLILHAQMKMDKRVTCTYCSDGYDAVSRCQNCSQYLCSDCDYVHKRHKLTNDHPLMSLDQVLEQPLKNLSNGHFCPQHPKYLIEFYCVTDDSLCCLSCTVLEHQGHQLQAVEEAAKPRLHALESSLKTVKYDKKTLEDRRMGQEHRKIAVETMQIHSRTKVEEQFTTLDKMMKDRKAAILNNIDRRILSSLSLCEESINTVDKNLANMETTEMYLTHARENSDAVEMLQMAQSLKRHFGRPTFKAIEQERKPEDFHLKLEPSFVSIIENILLEVGHIKDGTTVSVDSDGQERTAFLKDVFGMALKSRNKKELLAKLAENLQEKGICSRCNLTTDEPTKIRCRHSLCPRCYNTLFQPKEICPVCHKNCKVKTGNMPLGDMTTETTLWSLGGYEGDGTIKIQYSIDGAIQTHHHPTPQTAFRGTSTTAYLPDNREGRKVLALLKVAWERRLTFKIDLNSSGYYLSLRIPHKINSDGGRERGGYPDLYYLTHVTHALAELGVTEEDLEP